MEEWRQVKDYPELFEVSNLGQIRNRKNSKILKQYRHPHGYYHVATRVGGRGGKAVCFKVHREVAKAFIPNTLDLPMVNHIDAVKTNNCVTNLEWITAKGNALHAHKLGITNPPCQKHRRKLSIDEVLEVRSLYKPRDRTYGARAFGRKFGVDKDTILNIVNRVKYKDLE